jgi:hypothetical protein
MARETHNTLQHILGHEYAMPKKGLAHLKTPSLGLLNTSLKTQVPQSSHDLQGTCAYAVTRSSARRLVKGLASFFASNKRPANTFNSKIRNVCREKGLRCFGSNLELFYNRESRISSSELQPPDDGQLRADFSRRERPSHTSGSSQMGRKFFDGGLSLR